MGRELRFLDPVTSKVPGYDTSGKLVHNADYTRICFAPPNELIEEIYNARPLDIILCIDTSESMALPLPVQEASTLAQQAGVGQGNVTTRMDLARAMVRRLYHWLDDRDTLSLIAFSNDAQLKMPRTQMNEAGGRTLVTVIDQMRAEGGTDLCGAVCLAIDQAIRGIASNPKTAILVLTDGAGTVRPRSGNSEFREICNKLYAKAPPPLDQFTGEDRVFTISTFGYGDECDWGTLDQIAQEGSGVFAYCPSAIDVIDTFDVFMAQWKNLLSQRARFTGKGSRFVSREPGEIVHLFKGQPWAFVGQCVPGPNFTARLQIRDWEPQPVNIVHADPRPWAPKDTTACREMSEMLRRKVIDFLERYIYPPTETKEAIRQMVGEAKAAMPALIGTVKEIHGLWSACFMSDAILADFGEAADGGNPPYGMIRKWFDEFEGAGSRWLRAVLRCHKARFPAYRLKVKSLEYYWGEEWTTKPTRGVKGAGS